MAKDKMGFFDAAQDMFDRAAEETENAVKTAGEKASDAKDWIGEKADEAGSKLEDGVRWSWDDNYDEWKEDKDGG